MKLQLRACWQTSSGMALAAVSSLAFSCRAAANSRQRACRRQRTHKLKHDITLACATAGTAFAWLRLQGLQQLLEAAAGALPGGEVPLRAALEQTYSQVLEATLSCLERELLPLAGDTPQQGQATPAAAAAAAGEPLPVSYQAGYAPQHATPREWVASFQVLQVLCMFHPKVRQLMGTAQYLQMLTQRAVRCPSALPAFMDLLLLVLGGSEEAQALFVTTGGLEALLGAALEAAAPALANPSSSDGGRRGSGSDGGGRDSRGSTAGSSDGESAAEVLLMRLLVFLQLLQGWVLGEAVRRGAHPSTQKAAVQLVHTQLGSAAAVKLLSGLSQVVSSCSDVARMAAPSLQQQQQPQQAHREPLGAQGAAVADARAAGLLQERAVAARAVMTLRGKT